MAPKAGEQWIFRAILPCPQQPTPHILGRQRVRSQRMEVSHPSPRHLDWRSWRRHTPAPWVHAEHVCARTKRRKQEAAPRCSARGPNGGGHTEWLAWPTSRAGGLREKSNGYTHTTPRRAASGALNVLVQKPLCVDLIPHNYGRSRPVYRGGVVQPVRGRDERNVVSRGLDTAVAVSCVVCTHHPYFTE